MVPASFKQLRTKPIPSLGVSIEEYEHIKTGARHYHLASHNDENVFLVALRTMPKDSTGVAHILEHTALCGSKNYPVRDPFFMMIRRSLNTFMNAFTSSDWTAYPFASKNKKDFNNLLSVYLDAVFFATLDPQDFAQEGHRLEFQDPSDPSTPLQFKGVVYNEMKGAMSSVTSQLWQAFSKYLYPTNTYHFNSGGDPETILDLSYEDLKSFYEEHYHPSNAIFMTYGDIPASEHHDKLEAYLNQFEAKTHKIEVEDEKRYFAPLSVVEHYGHNETKSKTHHVIGWLLGHSANLDEQLEAHFLSSLLLENSSSPLRKALETTTLASSPSPLCGLEDSNKEMSFICGVEGSEPEHKEAIEDLILNTLQQVCKDGVNDSQIEAVLHQLELSQREVGGDGYPYGLQIILSAISACTHYSDPVELLDLDPALENLRAKSKSPDFIKNLIEKYLLNNPHRVTLTFKPDEHIDERKVKAESSKLDAIKESLSEAEIQSIVDQGNALKQRQLSKDDDSILPKVGIEDVAEKLVSPTPKKVLDNNGQSITLYEEGTNGLVYCQVLIDLPKLNEKELSLLPLLLSYITEVGCGDQDYLDIQERQSLVLGGISAYSAVKHNLKSPDELTAYWILSGKALSRNRDDFFALMSDTLKSPDFNNEDRVIDLLSQTISRKEQSISGNGHGIAMNIASIGISPLAALSYKTTGLPSLLELRNLIQESSKSELCNQLQTLHEKIIAGNTKYLLISDPENINDDLESLVKFNTINHSLNKSKYELDFTPQIIKEAWIVPTQANFCSKVYPTVQSDHDDAPALTVLGVLLRNGYLHTAIREQGGAYGGGASQDNSIGAFKFYSYRDPRVSGTFEDFNKAVEWFKSSEADSEALEQSILGVISSIDKPSSPAGEAKQSFHNDLHGKDNQWRNEFRQKILAVTYDDLLRVANDYFVESKASIAAVISAQHKGEAEDLGMNVFEI
ncbi:insulinase family protein [Oceaniserpentilla sp. 4NH20-0058]|uniref:insulinase family protein n=1 Tax=Oceaniserpentilla sp. 4NH20-0058 TaxID=3127660 RepID=UPI003106B8A1